LLNKKKNTNMAWRKNNPPLSPWRVVTVQAVAGLLCCAAVWAFTQRSGAAWSALYGAAAVVLPSALPELLNGIRTALALSFILLVSSELIVAREGLGYLIGFLGANGSYDAMYAVVLTVAFLGFAADRGYQMLMNRMLQWREQTP